ncbi:MAG: DUF4270 domain-containing protein [Bacteroidota bacterium]|nr:DUF4270 domain-containing protein [Bacteroidota bacterium]
MIRKLFTAFVAIAIFTLASCNKDDIHEVGLGLLDLEQLEVDRIDTISLKTHSVFEDSVRTDETFSALLGSSYDPVFGITDASIYTAMSLSLSAHSFGENPVADSIVFSLDYLAYYGDTTTVMTLHVNPLTEKIEKDSLYYSSKTFETNEAIDYANGFQFAPCPTDSVVVNGDTLKAHLRVPMDISLAQLLIEASDDDMVDASAFFEFFKGFHIYTDRVNNPREGSILSFGLTAQLTTLTMYYHNDSDTTSFDYKVYPTTPRIGNFSHDNYQTASEEFKQQLIQEDTLLGQQVVYCQTMAGVRTLIEIPYIDRLRERNMVVNNAYLYLPIQEDELYPAISSMNLIVKDGEAEYSYLSDDLESDNYFGGVLDETTNEYRFRVTKYIQQLLNDPEKSNTLLLQIPGSSDNPKRVIFNGPESEDNKIRLEVIYTKIN